MSFRVAFGFCLLLLAALPAHSQKAFQDPLDHPAALRTAVANRPLMAVARAGDRLVAVGSRGLVIVSHDGGKTWDQARVPVQSDLLSVHFPTPSDGWAVGHDGVVLNSSDGGRSWTKQLDGRVAAESLGSFYRKAGEAGDASVLDAARQLERNFKDGAALPYLDVWFESPQKGLAVGSYGMIIGTSDGGKTWEPWLHRVENEQWLNLNAIHGVGNDIYIAGEQGTVYKLDRAKGLFRKTSTGYPGSFFGIAGEGSTLIAFGLLGVAYRSDDGGVNWTTLKMPAGSTITAGARRPRSAGFVLVNDAGQILLSDASGREFRLVQPKKAMRLTGVVEIENALALTGLAGVTTEVLAP